MTSIQKLRAMEKIVSLEYGIRRDKDLIKEVQKQKRTADYRVGRIKKHIKETEQQIRELTNGL